MSNFNIQDRLVRFGELIPCKTAFIDAHTPGSNLKENFTIIGAGVSENPDQHVHICLLYTSPSPRDRSSSRMPSSA